MLLCKVWSAINQLEDQQATRQSFAIPSHCPVNYEQHGCLQTASQNSTQTDGSDPTNDDTVMQTDCTVISP